MDASRAYHGTLAIMDDSNTDDPLPGKIEFVARDVLARIGDSPDTRFEFFRRFVELTREITHARELPVQH